MRELSVMDKVQARPPSADDLIKAFNTFFNYKIKNGEIVEDIAAQHVLRTFRHLRDMNTDQEGFGLSDGELRAARDAMMVMPATKRAFHRDFARDVFAELQRRNSNIIGDGQNREDGMF
jgi:hypothetical protein